jgi:hypothetical protein
MMKKVLVVLAVLGICALGYSADVTHVFWYKATTNGYALTAASPGPALPAGAVVHEGKMMSACLAQHNGSTGDSFVMGSGLDDTQGRCGVFWSRDLCDMTGTATSAKYRAEYRDAWAGNALCNAGPIKIHRGVVDFQGNIDFWTSADLVDDAAVWKDDANMLGSFMGYNALDPVIKALDSVDFTALAGKPSGVDPSVLDGQFVDIDVTPQVNWILQNTMAAGNPNSLSGQYAIVCLVTPGVGSTGKVNTMSSEAGVMGTLTSDAPWTTDGNSGHLVVVGTLTSVEKSAAKVALNTVSLSQNTPNPFMPRTSIAYNTNGKSGSLKIFDATGKLVSSQSVSGKGSVEWNAGSSVSGIYMYRLTIGSQVISKKMILMK